MRIFITGGTGLVGTRLVPALVRRGDRPVVLTRRLAAAQQLFGTDCDMIEGDPMQAGAWQEAVDTCDAVINLAGENIFARRWNAPFKDRLLQSRVQATTHVVTALKGKPKRADGSPKVLVNASAIGYYGPHGDEELTEQSPPGNDFMAGICVEWEKAAQPVQGAGVRLVLVRIGIVLDRRGGALPQMLTPFKMFVGGPVGRGKQYMSWIHHDDLVGLLLLALDRTEASGPLNGTAPNPVSNREFSKALGRALHRPSVLPVPAFALRLRFGQVAQVVATGQRVLPRAALGLGYPFKFPTIDAALADILK
jgi:uncharacterized protein (TIGR01777 family)